MAEQDRLKIKSREPVKFSDKKVIRLHIVLSDKTTIEAFFPRYLNIPNQVNKAQEETWVDNYGDSICHREALAFAKEAIKDYILKGK